MRRTHRIAIVLAAVSGLPHAAGAQDRNPHRDLRGRDCVQCHTTSDWSVVRFDHQATRFPLTGQHVAAPCSGCHDVRNFSGAAADCRACHQDPHRGDAGMTCEQCHNTSGWTQVRASDAHARTRLPDLGVHASLRCADCHRTTGVQQFTAAVAACVTCHRPTYEATTNPRHTAINIGTRCDECHQLAAWQPALFAQHDVVFGIYRGEHAGQWRSCASCHPVSADYRVYTCTTCHANGPTTEEHQGIAGYAWESTACLGCHPGGSAEGDLSFHAPLFPVLSGPHAGQWTSCAQCHTSPAERAVVSCLTAGCHAQAATDPPHNQIPGYAYETQQCRSCHPDGTAGTFAAHDAIFPIFAGPHSGTWPTCAACHTDPASRSVFSCVSAGCHAQAATTADHDRIPGYAYQSAQCLSCHPDGRAGTFAQHDAVWPVYSGPHAGSWNDCAQCHTTPGDRSVVSCVTAGCHASGPTNAFHVQMPGYSYATAQCRSCHPDGQSGRFTAHDPTFPIYSGTHATRWAACTTCHTDPASRSVFTCLASGCHAQTETNGHHSGIAGYAYQSAQCYSCHPDGQAGTFTQHDAVFPVFTGTHAGKWTGCEQCHFTPGNRSDVSCMTAGCHPQAAANTFHLSMTGYTYTPAACRTCHADGTRGRYTAHDPRFPIYSGTHATRWAACTTCHTNPASRGTFTCLASGCHAQAETNGDHSGIPGYSYQSAQCFSCHPDGQTGTFTQHDLIFPIFNGGHEGEWSSCASCHPVAGDRSQFTCMGSGCHAATGTNNDHREVSGYQFVASACLTCHPRGEN